MKLMNKARRSRLFALVTAVVVAVLSACGGGTNLQSGIEGTGITDTVAVVSRGPIQAVDGFDVEVNGVSWSAVAAETLIDGAPGSVADLRVGMMVTVQGEQTDLGERTANVIRTGLIVRGPIREVDAATGRLDVLGQTVRVDWSTALDVPFASLEALSNGEVVAVSGFITAEKEVRATRIATVTASAESMVVGAVTSVDAGASRFSVNGLEIVYDSGLTVGLPSGAIEIGQLLIVSGMDFTPDGALIATSLAVYDGSLPAPSDKTVISGIIIKIDGNDVFFWDQHIYLPAGEVSPEGLVTGMYIRVEGTMSGTVLHASDVRVLGDGPRSGLVGRIEAIDADAGTITLLGVEFTLTNELLAEIDLSRGDLEVGERVYVSSYQNRLIHWIDHGDYWEWYNAELNLIEGELGDLYPPLQFTLHGVTDWVVQVGAETLLGYIQDDPDRSSERCDGLNPVSAERFWEIAAQPSPNGVPTVWTWGRFEGDVFLAESASICFPAAP
jgi:hypothetical protein